MTSKNLLVIFTYLCLVRVYIRPQCRLEFLVTEKLLNEGHRSRVFLKHHHSRERPDKMGRGIRADMAGDNIFEVSAGLGSGPVATVAPWKQPRSRLSTVDWDDTCPYSAGTTAPSLGLAVHTLPLHSSPHAPAPRLLVG